MVSIRDVAREAGVSQATVSRVLAGRRPVRPDLRERVMCAAHQLGYVPNLVARNLAKRRTYLLGVLVTDITNPFFPEIVQGIEATARAAGYNILLGCSNWDANEERRYLSILRGHQVDGILLVPCRSERNVKLLTENGIPVVLITQTMPHVDSVCVDHAKGGYIAGKHLVGLGHCRIACIGQIAEEKVTGFRQALAESNVSVPEELIGLMLEKSTTWIEAGRLTTKELFGRDPTITAVFAVNDLFAVGAMQALKEMGRSVPQDVAVVSFDNTVLASATQLGLTSVAQPTGDIGRLATERLIDRIEGRAGDETIQLMLEPRLVVRESSCIRTRVCS